jgi:hypothetical protein
MINMKRKILFGATFLFIVWSAASCEKLAGCKKCKDVTYNNSGSVINSGPETEYCGTDLIVKEATKDYVLGTQTTKVECH